MANGLRVRVLGPLDVSCRGVAVGPGGARRRSLFAMLALRANELCGLDSIVDGLWGPRPPASATGVVQTYVSTWRKALDDDGDPGVDRIQTVGGAYRLRLAEDECDLLLFRQLADQGRRAMADGSPAAARAPLERALALWRGPVLADLAGEPFHAEASAALEERRVQAVELWAEALLRTAPAAHLTPVIASLEGLRREQPWRERVSELLLWALARQGRQGEALAAFAATRRALADELGIDPGPALAAMHERVLRQDPGLLEAVPDTRAPDGARRVAGCGSTRSSAGSATWRRSRRCWSRPGWSRSPVPAVPGSPVWRRRSPSASDGGPATAPSWWSCPRSTTTTSCPGRSHPGWGSRRPSHWTDSSRSWATVRSSSSWTTSSTCRAWARPSTPCSGAPRGSGSWPPPAPLSGCRASSSTASRRWTCRHAADVDAGRVAATPAVRLLLDRARASDPHLDVTPDNAETLGRIARMLDGLPLALEIVAPWLRPLTPDGVLEQLQRPLDIAGRGIADARHRTLRDTIAWSSDRLSPSSGTCSPACRCCAGAGISTPSPPSRAGCWSDRSSTSSWTWSTATSSSRLPR